MHSYDVRKRALLAVAKLSIFAGAVGCGGSVVVETDPLVAHEPGASVDASSSSSGGAPSIPVAPRPSNASCFDPSTNVDACCSEVLTAAFADDHLFTDPTLATDEQLACCDLVVTTLVEWNSVDPPPFHWALETNCCVVDPGVSAVCTAWGPPMPPAMRPAATLRGQENNEVVA